MKRFLVFLCSILMIFSLTCLNRPHLAYGDFIRGDANFDTHIDISDPAFISNYLFKGGPGPTSGDAMDSNDDSHIDLTDFVYPFNYLFLGGPPPPAPFPDPGTDPTPDDLEPDAVDSPEERINNGTALSFDAPTTIVTAPFSLVEIPVTVLMDTEMHDVEAWSLGVGVLGTASIVDVTFDGTDAAGLFDVGAERTELTSGAGNEGAVSAVTLSIPRTASLASEGTYSILQFTLQGFAPDDGNTDLWNLSFTSSLQGSGQPVETIASVWGERYLPTLEGLQIEVTGDSSVPSVPDASIMFLLGPSIIGLFGLGRRRFRN